MTWDPGLHLKCAGERMRPALDLLARIPLPAAQSIVDLWTTEYLHLLPAGDGIEHPVIAWTRGSALKPFLESLDAPAKEAFLDGYGTRVAAAYPRRSDGRVMFAFRRRFMVAVRASVAGGERAACV
jgi:trans-aconitate methyltransferase